MQLKSEKFNVICARLMFIFGQANIFFINNIYRYVSDTPPEFLSGMCTVVTVPSTTTMLCDQSFDYFHLLMIDFYLPRQSGGIGSRRSEMTFLLHRLNGLNEILTL